MGGDKPFFSFFSDVCCGCRLALFVGQRLFSRDGELGHFEVFSSRGEGHTLPFLQVVNSSRALVVVVVAPEGRKSKDYKAKQKTDKVQSVLS